MRCHTWPPAASDPHMGVRATMSDPPSPAPGWHILIHERAWALSGQNYPYQNATINAFINPTSESAPFRFKQSLSKNSSSLVLCMCPPSDYLKAHLHTIIPLNTFYTNACSHSLLTRSDTPVCQWSGSSPLLPNGPLSYELSVPQVLVSLSADLLTQNTLNVNRSS